VRRCSVRSGDYVSQWSAHGGTHYGIPRAPVDAALAKGSSVVLNVSRSAFGGLREAYAGRANVVALLAGGCAEIAAFEWIVSTLILRRASRGDQQDSYPLPRGASRGSREHLPRRASRGDQKDTSPLPRGASKGFTIRSPPRAPRSRPGSSRAATRAPRPSPSASRARGPTRRRTSRCRSSACATKNPRRKASRAWPPRSSSRRPSSCPCSASRAARPRASRRSWPRRAAARAPSARVARLPPRRAPLRRCAAT